MKLIDKSALVAKIDRRINEMNLDNIDDWRYRLRREHDIEVIKDILSLINSLEVIDPYEQWIQYSSIEAGIKAHAEEYSFNIESELFNQLTKEQQALWRKEIEEAVISGGYNGLTLAKDPRYKENHEVKEVDFQIYVGEELENFLSRHKVYDDLDIAKYFFELGLKVQKRE